MIDALLQEKISARLHEATPTIPVGVSNRHVHLSQQDVEALFGKGYALTPFKPLRQPGQFAAEECVTVVGPKGSLTQVRVLGPTRPTTQLEVSRAEQLREMANKAELRALQSKINPHFLFNALNAISSSIRLNPDTARQLIFNLSRYLRYNIELKDDEQIDIKRELYQIKDYIAIEQARFGDKLTVIYDIDDDVSCVIPSLLIQPLVENAIVHGIQPCKGKGVVTIGINECGNRVRISVRDTGNGIDPAVVARVEADEMPGNKIGLLNVHHRVKLLYGEGLHIRNLTPGTEIAFYVPNNSTPQALTESRLS